MIYQETKLNLKDTANKLLSENVELSEKKVLIDQLHLEFSTRTGIRELSKHVASHASLPLQNGSALSVIHAADCIKDYHRTIQLLRGLNQAINDVLIETPQKQVHVFYAGTGPFSPFVHLLAQIFSEKQLVFTLMEINPESMTCCKQLVEGIGSTGFVKEFLLEDAITYKIPNPETVDILFSETLDSLLRRESYVPILLNLKPQLESRVKVIPENVVLNLVAYKDAMEGFQKKELGEIFNVAQLVSNPKERMVNEEYVQCAIIPVSKELEGYRFMIHTNVQVYKEFCISLDQSSISLSYEFEIKTPLSFNRFNFSYDLWPNLELKCDFENV